MLQEGFITFFEIIKAILMGIVEGITEWLPISSTGHMILVEQVVKFNASEEFMSMFRVVIQLGAILVASFCQSYFFVVEVVYDDRFAFFRASVWQIVYTIREALLLGVI